MDGEYVFCHNCDGTGKDESDYALGRCFYCGGTGQCFVPYSQDDDWDDYDDLSEA